MLFLPPAQVAEPSKPAAVEALRFDLPGAIQRAREENPQLKAASARVEERRSLITTTRADALPQLTAIGDFTRVRDVSILNSGFGDSAAQFGFSPESLVGARSVYTAQLNLTQPLFYFGKLKGAVEVAKVGEKEARAAYTTAELDILHGVAKAYLGVLGAKAQLDVVEVRRKTAQQFLDDVKAKLEEQSATQLDLLRAQAELQGVVPEALQAEADYQRAMELLDGALGYSPSTPLQLADLGRPGLPGDLAGTTRSELLQLDEQEKAFRINDKILASDMRPKLDFNASYGYQAGKTDNLFKEPYDAWRVSLTLKVPVFDGLRSSGKRAQNRAQLEQVHQAKVDAERQIQVQQQTARRELVKAQALMDAATQAHDAGAEALRVSRESFEQGLITSLDLLQAERQERQLESQRVRAELGLWSALFDLRRSVGLGPL
ncbi:MAG TPA: TolC family protein [Holophagaceae bacterium]|nr:TolC family protein [Holophagaceae bacterium]